MVVLFIAKTMLFVILLSLLYYGYCVINDIDPFYFLFKTNTASSSDVFSKTPPAPDTSALGYCTIDSQELYNYYVYTYDNKQVPTAMPPIPCSQCNQYIYRDDSGKCSQYMFDQTANTNYDDSKSASSFCDPSKPDSNKNCIQPHGVCSVNPVSKKCPF